MQGSVASRAVIVCYNTLMKKFIVVTYLILTISIMLTAASWLTWGSSCQYITLIPEGQSYSGMCAGDGVQYAGIFVFCLVITLAYLGITALVLKLLGFKLTKK
jgi:hypothetical protein